MVKAKASSWRRKQLGIKQEKIRATWILGVKYALVLAILLVSSWLAVRARGSLWNGSSRFSLIYSDNVTIQVKNFIPQDKKIVILEIPGEIYTTVPFGYGDYQIKNIYKLGELDDRGGPLLKSSLQALMGIPIDGYVVGNKSDLSWWDMVRLYYRERIFKSDLVKLTTFSDAQINEDLFDDQVAGESINVAIVNASGVEGQARLYARMIANLGGRVVFTGTAIEQDKSYILLNEGDLNRSNTFQLVQRIMGKEVEVKSGNTSEYLGELVIFLGKDAVGISQ